MCAKKIFLFFSFSLKLFIFEMKSSHSSRSWILLDCQNIMFRGTWIQRRICVSQRSIIFIHLPFLYNVRDLNSFASLNVPTYISYIYTFRKSGIILKTFQHLAFKSTVFRNISLGRKKEEAYPSYDSPRNFRSNVLFPTRDRIFPLSRFRA